MFKSTSIRQFFLRFFISSGILLMSGLVLLNVFLQMDRQYQSIFLNKIYPLHNQLQLINDTLNENFYTLNLWIRAPDLKREKELTEIMIPKMIKDIKILKPLLAHQKKHEEYQVLYGTIKQLMSEEYRLLINIRESGVLTRFRELESSLNDYYDKINQNMRYEMQFLSKKNLVNFLLFYQTYQSLHYNSKIAIKSRSAKDLERLLRLKKSFQSQYQDVHSLFLNDDINKSLIRQYDMLIENIIELKEKSLINPVDDKIIHTLAPLRDKVHQTIFKLMNESHDEALHFIRLTTIYAYIAFCFSAFLILLFCGIGYFYMKKFASKLISPMESLIKNMTQEDREDFSNITLPDNTLQEITSLFHNYNHLMKRQFGSEKQLKKQTSYLSYLVSHDAVTEMSNYRAFKQVFENREKHLDFNVDKILFCYLSINNYNDLLSLLGQSQMNKALKALSKQLVTFESYQPVCCRYSDASFLIMLTCPKLEYESEVLSEWMTFSDECFKKTRLYPTAIYTTVLFSYPKYHYQLDELVRHCQFTVAESKDIRARAGVVYSDAHELAFKKIVNIKASIKYAIEMDEVEVLYQPQYDIHTEGIIGCEALIRWHHPEMGYVSANKFIEIAEQTGIINEIGQYLQSQSFKDYNDWVAETTKHLKLSINASLIELLNEDYLPQLLQNLETHQITPSNIEIELTESLLDLSSYHLNDILKKIKDAGISIAIDDFGTGYSSLERLHQLEFDLIKIDKVFIDKIVTHDRDRHLLIGILNLAKVLGLKVIAEGVESKVQIEYLRQYDCDYIQGYYYSKPLTAKEFIALLKR